MANTDSKNFRCDTQRWTDAMTKLENMRASGYDIDMTRALVAEVTRLGTETVKETAERLGLERESVPVKPYRAPRPRVAQ